MRVSVVILVVVVMGCVAPRGFAAAQLSPVVAAPLLLAGDGENADTLYAREVLSPRLLGPSGDRVFFVGVGADTRRRVGAYFTANVDGTGLTRVPVSVRDTVDPEFVASRDGRYVASFPFNNTRRVVDIVDLTAGKRVRVTGQGRPQWRARGGLTNRNATFVVPAPDGGYYVHFDQHRLFHFRPGSTGLEAVPVTVDGRLLRPGKTRVYRDWLPEQAMVSHDGKSIGYCETRFRNDRPSGAAMGVLDRGVIRYHTLRTTINLDCLTSDDGSAVVTTAPRADGGTSIVAARRGGLVRVKLGKQYGEVQSVSPSGRYAVVLKSRHGRVVDNAPVMLVDFDRRTARVISGARIKLGDGGGPDVNERVRWSADNRYAILLNRANVTSIATTSGRTAILSEPAISKPVLSHDAFLSSRDGKWMTVVAYDDDRFGHLYATPLDGSPGARPLLDRPITPYGTITIERAADASHVLFSNIGEIGDPLQFVLSGSTPDPLTEPWTLPAPTAQ